MRKRKSIFNYAVACVALSFTVMLAAIGVLAGTASLAAPSTSPLIASLFALLLTGIGSAVLFLLDAALLIVTAGTRALSGTLVWFYLNTLVVLCLMCLVSKLSASSEETHVYAGKRLNSWLETSVASFWAVGLLIGIVHIAIAGRATEWDYDPASYAAEIQAYTERLKYLFTNPEDTFVGKFERYSMTASHVLLFVLGITGIAISSISNDRIKDFNPVT